jgi:uncharacterized protein YjbI with pentapeptide repeats
MGWQAGEALIEDIVFEGCKLDMAGLRFCTIKSVLFHGCSLKGADFQGSSFKEVRVERCDLDEAEFRQSTVTSMDLRSSEIGGVRYVEGLRGATIDQAQLFDLAAKLAQVVGLKVDRGNPS